MEKRILNLKMAKHEVIRITDKLANTLQALYQAGVFASVLGFAGILVMLGAHILGLGGDLSPWLFILGSVLTVSAFGLLLFTTIKSHAKATRTLKESKDTLDAMQDISLQLIRLANILHSYSFKNVGKLNEFIQLVASVIDSIPFLGDKVRKYGLSEATALSQAMVENAEKVENIINNVEQALINGDYEKIAEYSNELSDWVESLSW